jgi:hypothetical protein
MRKRNKMTITQKIIDAFGTIGELFSKKEGYVIASLPVSDRDGEIYASRINLEEHPDGRLSYINPVSGMRNILPRSMR